MTKITLLRCLAVCALAVGIAAAQQPSRALGVVQSIDPTNGQIILKTDAGASLKIVPQSGARFVRVPPGETSLAKGTPITAADIDAGDRLLARGQLSDDKNSLAATLLVVMTKADLAKKHAADRAEWQKRGVGGIVTAVDPAAGTVTITARSAEGAKPLTIVAGPKTVVRRYAPDSVKFDDAKPSTVAVIKPGDQVRALGEKSADGTSFTAEELVSGAFRNVAATVTTIDPATGSLKVTDLVTKKPLVVRVNGDSTLRKLPENVARMIAMRLNGGSAGAAQGASGGGPSSRGGQSGSGTQPGSGGQSSSGAQAGSGAQPGAGGARRSGDLQQMLERMPPIKLEDLKPGDAIIVTSTEGTDPGQVTAITLLAGVEPILTATPASRRTSMLGSWNLEMDTGGMQ